MICPIAFAATTRPRKTRPRHGMRMEAQRNSPRGLRWSARTSYAALCARQRARICLDPFGRADERSAPAVRLAAFVDQLLARRTFWSDVDRNKLAINTHVDLAREVCSELGKHFTDHVPILGCRWAVKRKAEGDLVSGTTWMLTAPKLGGDHPQHGSTKREQGVDAKVIGLVGRRLFPRLPDWLSSEEPHPQMLAWRALICRDPRGLPRCGRAAISVSAFAARRSLARPRRQPRPRR